MAKYVPDIKTQRWIVISTGRTHRPDTTNKKPPQAAPSQKGPKPDPFAQGNEHMTPAEVFRIGDGEPNKPGWKVRVVPNKFPITDTHEVVIHSPDPINDIEDLPIDQVNHILQSYRHRYNDFREHGHVLIFANHGAFAGASLTHPHSQLVVIPKQINLDVLEREPVNNVVETGNSFTVYCPDFSQWPYETWIVPKQNDTYFGDHSDDDLKELSGILKSTLCRLRACYEHPETKKIRADIPFSYNYYIYHGKNWYLRIIPRLIHRAGFELGTGLSVNMIDPEDAAANMNDKEFCKVGL